MSLKWRENDKSRGVQQRPLLDPIFTGQPVRVGILSPPPKDDVMANNLPMWRPKDPLRINVHEEREIQYALVLGLSTGRRWG